jgi:hypothetical protein
MHDSANEAYLAAARSNRQPSENSLSLFRSLYYRFEFKALDGFLHRDNAGSMWRGIFGAALRQTVCSTGLDDCRQCLLFRQCSYPYLFDTPLPENANRMTRYTSVPHPYVFKAGRFAGAVKPGELFSVDLCLFGNANDYLPHIILAFEKAGRIGLAGENARFERVSVSQVTAGGDTILLWQPGASRVEPVREQPVEIPPVTSETLQIDLVTPMRLLTDGRPLAAQDFRFHHLFRSVLRRLPMLMYFHQGLDLQLPFKALSEQAYRVEILDAELGWHEWKRYSNRQKTAMKMGGLSGRLLVDFQGFESLWPILWLGQFTHAGKATTMGNGEYYIH